MALSECRWCANRCIDRDKRQKSIVEDKKFKDDVKENRSNNLIENAVSEQSLDETNDATHAKLQSLAECCPDEAKIVEKLIERFPEAPQQELLRFARARQGSLEEASNMYGAFLQWRQGQGTPANLLQAHQTIDSKYIRHIGFAKDGSVLLLVQGARYDTSAGPEATALAFGHVVFSLANPKDLQKCTVLLDVRPAEGWPNVNAFQMVPFFRMIAGIAQANFPERLQRLVIFPMPLVVRGLWAMVSRFLAPRTQNKVVILGGAADLGSPCPTELQNYCEFDQIPLDARHMFQELGSK